MLLMRNLICRKSSLFDHVTRQISDSALCPPSHLFPPHPLATSIALLTAGLAGTLKQECQAVR